MNPAQTAQLAEIESLLAERRKIEQWLATLESRRAATPAQVYERVHADYTTKRDAAQDALRTRVETVRGVVAELAQALAAQELGIEQRRDARAEAELRALVGEFSEAEWETRRVALDDELQALQEARDESALELDRLRTLLSDAQPGYASSASPTAATPMAASPTIEVPAMRVPEAEVAPEPEPVPVVEPVVEPEIVPDAAPTASAELAPVVEPIAESVPFVEEPEPLPEVEELLPAFDEPEVVHPTHPTPTNKPDWASVFATDPAIGEDEGPFAEPSSAPAAPAAPTAPRSATPAPPAPPVPEERDELAFLRSVLGRSTPMATPAPDLQAIEAPQDTPAAPRPTPMELSADEARHSGAFPASARPLGAPTPSTAQAARTLSCQECGAMNFPTEWYCEKCGGELAAY